MYATQMMLFNNTYICGLSSTVKGQVQIYVSKALPCSILITDFKMRKFLHNMYAIASIIILSPLFYLAPSDPMYHLN